MDLGTRIKNPTGLMADNGYSYPSDTELRNVFASSCVEAAARRLQIPAVEMYRRMKRVGFMKVYHGSTFVIEHPIASVGRRRLDFGQGFYVTDIKIQADLWAERMQRIREEAGIVNIYEMDIDGLFMVNGVHSSFSHLANTGSERNTSRPSCSIRSRSNKALFKRGMLEGLPRLYSSRTARSPRSA